MADKKSINDLMPDPVIKKTETGNRIAYFDPQARNERRDERLAQFSDFDAARSDRTTGAWTATDTNLNDLINLYGGTIRSRIRELIRNVSYFSGAVKRYKSLIIGSGIKYQAKIKTNGILDEELNSLAEKEFNDFIRPVNFDISGRLHFYDIQALSIETFCDSGESILIVRNNPGKKIPFAIQIVDPLNLNGFKQLYKNSMTQNGIEFDTSTGKVLAYHFSDSYGNFFSVDAGSIIHSFDTIQPGQVRGISPFVSCVMLIDQLRQAIDNEQFAALMASKFVAMIQSDEATGLQKANSTSSIGLDKFEEVSKGIIQYLTKSENFSIVNNNRPGDNFIPFVKMILQGFAADSGLPYPMISGSYEDMNYTTLRAARSDLEQWLTPVISRHIRQVEEPILERFWDAAVLNGILPVSKKEYLDDKQKFLAAEWQVPGLPPVDSLKEVRAAVESVEAGILSPQEFCREWGVEFETMQAEIDQFTRINNPRKVTSREDSI